LLAALMRVDCRLRRVPVTADTPTSYKTLLATATWKIKIGACKLSQIVVHAVSYSGVNEKDNKDTGL
jgi:hypothetical protein